MPSKEVVMEIKKPHFTVKLHETLLEVDLNEGLRKELEDFIEAKPALKRSLGFLFQTIIPLDVPLRQIDSVKVDKTGKVEVKIPHRRNLVIPLTPKEAKLFVEKLEELVAVEKEKIIEEKLESERAKTEDEAKHALGEEEEVRERLHPA